jgi:hypothetical protein
MPAIISVSIMQFWLLAFWCCQGHLLQKLHSPPRTLMSVWEGECDRSNY